MSLTRARRRRATSRLEETLVRVPVEGQQPKRTASVVVRARFGRSSAQPSPIATPRDSRQHVTAEQVRAAAGDAPVPHWQQSQHWFWFGEADTSGIRTLVVPLGETYEQGPHLMTRFRTQDGRIQSCSVEFFERHTERCRTMRRLAA